MHFQRLQTSTPASWPFALFMLNLKLVIMKPQFGDHETPIAVAESPCLACNYPSTIVFLKPKVLPEAAGHDGRLVVGDDFAAIPK